MTELSPAARSILAAATQRIYNLDPEDVPLSASEHGSVIAAALRLLQIRWCRKRTPIVPHAERVA